MDQKEMRIVVRMPNWLGDLVMAFAAFEDLRKAYPTAHLAVVCLPCYVDLVKRSLGISEIIEIKKRGIREIFRTSIEIRKREFTHGILFTNSFSDRKSVV